MEESRNTSITAGKAFKLFLKIAVSVACLWYVSGKIDFQKAGEALKNANWLFLALALIAFILSKLISAHRLNLYFRNIGIYLSQIESTRLYWLGMFYNLFLPGSITGDAYKVILLTKKYDVPYRKTAAAVLLDRFSGLLGLGLILCIYSFFVLPNSLHILLIVGGALLATLGFYLIIRTYFRDFLQSFTPTLFLGLLVQAAQVICIYLIMATLHIPVNASEYIFLFLVSSVVSVLPLTIGGLGIRELVFLEGSRYLGLQQENAVLISLLFYLITLFSSAWGIWYVFKNPLAPKPKTI